MLDPKVLVALDYQHEADALAFIERISPAQCRLKVGKEMFTLFGPQFVRQLVAKGFDRATVKKVEHLLYLSEYKRFQSAPGTRLTRKAFWMDRRYPIVNRWRDGS